MTLPPLPFPISPELLFALAVAGLLLAFLGLLLGAVALRRAGALRRHYDALMTGVDGERLATALEAYVGRQTAAEGRLARLEAQTTALEKRMGRVVNSVRVSRYNAFEDTGGDQSFSMALLNDAGDGAIITGLHSRTGVKVYAKPIQAWRSGYSLTPQEAAVIEPAD